LIKRFIITGHKATTSGEFSLNDMPGSAGRMDVLCRSVNSCFFLSHSLREDVWCYLILLGEPNPPITILIKGNEVKRLNPDERSTGALIKKALTLPCGEKFRKSTPGVYIRKGGLKTLLEEIDVTILDENGEDIRDIQNVPDSYLLSDHLNFTDEETELIIDLPKISAGPKVMHADHTITVILNEFDRRKL